MCLRCECIRAIAKSGNEPRGLQHVRRDIASIQAICSAASASHDCNEFEASCQTIVRSYIATAAIGPRANTMAGAGSFQSEHANVAGLLYRSRNPAAGMVPRREWQEPKLSRAIQQIGSITGL